MIKQSPDQIVLSSLIETLKGALTPILAIPKVWLDEKEAGRYLSFSVHTLRAWRSKGNGPDYFKLQSRVLYRKEDLDHWVEEHRVRRKKEGHQAET